MRTRKQSGFTLVEILIVVVILGILAAIVIPQFSQASTDAKLNSLSSDLQTMRSQIALFKIQHTDTNPPAITATTTTWDEMTQYTDVLGTTISTTKTATCKYGPYLQQAVPNNPFTNVNTVTAATSGAAVTGWAYDAATGQIRAGYSGLTDTAAIANIKTANYE